MHFFHIFITISMTLSVSAVPIPVNPDDRSISYGPIRRGRDRPTEEEELARPLRDPRIIFQKEGGVPQQYHEDAKAEVLKDFHKFSAENPASAEMTKSAHVPGNWVYLHDRQCLQVYYRRGMRPWSYIVNGGARKVYRDIPPEKPLALSFTQSLNLKRSQIRELTDHITEYHNAHPPNSPYRRAHVTWVGEGWRPGGGNTDEIRDHVKFTYHHSVWRTDKNMIGEPHVIRRPLTVSFGNEVDPGSRDLIEKKVRKQHASLGPTDKAKPSNVALVVGGSYKNTQGKDEAQVGYYEFPDCPKSQDKQYKDHGRYPVALE